MWRPSLSGQRHAGTKSCVWAESLHHKHFTFPFLADSCCLRRSGAKGERSAKQRNRTPKRCHQFRHFWPIMTLRFAFIEFEGCFASKAERAKRREQGLNSSDDDDDDGEAGSDTSWLIATPSSGFVLVRVDIAWCCKWNVWSSLVHIFIYFFLANQAIMDDGKASHVPAIRSYWRFCCFQDLRGLHATSKRGRRGASEERKEKKKEGLVWATHLWHK